VSGISFSPRNLAAATGRGSNAAPLKQGGEIVQIAFGLAEKHRRYRLAANRAAGAARQKVCNHAGSQPISAAPSIMLAAS
jgi:hypothetical protein